MATYEFQCPRCRKVFTVLQGMQEDHSAECPDCHVSANRQWGGLNFSVDWVNGGFHGNDINMGTGEYHKSVKDREYWAESHGLQKTKDG